jgi:hypothetical protein
MDFSFVRSVSADAYSIFGAPCYDPVSLFVLDLFCYLDKICDIKHFCFILRDPGLGQSYRTVAGFRDDFIPCRVRTECPNANFPEDIKHPKITILSFTLENASQELSALGSNNLKFFHVEEPLVKHGLVLRFPESHVHALAVSSFIGEIPDSFRFRCPKLPYDRDARIGVRRKPANPDKTEKIFGYSV